MIKKIQFRKIATNADHKYLHRDIQKRPQVIFTKLNNTFLRNARELVFSHCIIVLSHSEMIFSFL